MILAGCRRQPSETFGQLVEEAVYQSLAFSPVSATQAGYHRHKDQNLDEMLDDFSEAGLIEQRQYYRTLRDRLAKAIEPARMSPEDQADFDILNDQISLRLLELDEIQSYRHNPTVYVELIGNALFNPMVLEYAPKEQRYRHIIARLEKVPALLSQARRNLLDSAPIWTTVAQEENDGNIALVDKGLRAAAPEPLRADYDRAAGPALEALRAFNAWLKDHLARHTTEWQLGKTKYTPKFRYVLATDETPLQVLAAAEEDLRRIRQEMFKLSLPLHAKMFPNHKDPVDLNLIVGEVLGKIAEKHATRDTYFSDARRDLDEARRFVQEKGLLPLPPRDNLQVIETPEFMRGIYAVGGFSPAPALEPQLGAFYWLTPIPGDWPRQRTESKLREYNDYALKLLTIHEAMPGHYVQFEYAHGVEPRARRLLRGVYGSGPYVEGWAVYATEMMLDEGYLDKSPELRLAFLKQQLRMIANAILDVRLQTMYMSDQDAMDLMLKQTFQEAEEATAKLRRAKLSSCQLPTYYAGWREWVRLREQYQKSKGAAFRLAEFHERALKTGAIPMRSLGRLLGG
jgi:uncharacterized protein (DUF885 family)